MSKEPGHTFLAKLGKTRLRPGGKKATDWLITQGQFSYKKQVLEVACNMCTTSIYLAKTYQCHITAVDLNKKALDKGRLNVKKAHLEHLIQLQQANAIRLPFEDNQFDIILNEAMLTMLPMKAKQQAVAEYFRVLKPGGILLTQDVAVMNDDKEKEVIQHLSSAINVNVTPLTPEHWTQLYKEAGFSSVHNHYEPMTLMTPKGMIYDEGIFGTIKIIKNALKKDNRSMFKRMFITFKNHKSDLNYIVHAATK